VDGSFEQIESILATIADQPGWYEATTKRSANPYQAEAPKTIAYEIFLELGRAPDWAVVPVGGGATLYGMWRGFLDLLEMGRIDRLPRMVSVQPSKFNALEIAMARGLKTHADLVSIGLNEHGTTVAGNLKHAVPPDGADALQAVRETSGLAISVTDEDALRGQWALGAREGILCEPSSSVVAIGVEELVRVGAIREKDCVVGVITGSGLRELAILGQRKPGRRVRLPPTAGREDLESCCP
jgi:threonine synthase